MKKPLKIACPPDKMRVRKTSERQFWLQAMMLEEVTLRFLREQNMKPDRSEVRYCRTDVIYVAVD